MTNDKDNEWIEFVEELKALCEKHDININTCRRATSQEMSEPVRYVLEIEFLKLLK